MSPTSAISTSSKGSFRSIGSNDSRSTAGRSQLHWQGFRRDSLASHHIRVLDSSAGQSLPKSIISYIEAHRNHAAHIAAQREHFRSQITAGKGFGPSAFFPQEVLPSITENPALTRCMVPSLSQDALPERMTSTAFSNTALSSPRPALGCGFSNSAFTAVEHRNLPRHLYATGTIYVPETHSMASGSALYAPYMTFERAFSQESYGIEVATNQCAVSGAWSIRSLQMLFAKAAGEEVRAKFDDPIAFSCCIDNEIAILYIHTIDHAQVYCASPVVRFELAKDMHFDQLIIWCAAINQWAVNERLPEIKKALTLIDQHTMEPVSSSPSSPSLNVKAPSSPAVASMLEEINNSWKGLQSPGLSSVKSWSFSKVEEQKQTEDARSEPPYPTMKRSLSSDPNISRPRFPPSPGIISDLHARTKIESQRTVSGSCPSSVSSDAVMRKRLDNATAEILELQSQLMTLRQETSGMLQCMQAEMSGIRKAFSVVVRKDRISPKAKSPLRITPPSSALYSPNAGKNPTIVTTPTEPRPNPWQTKSTVRIPSRLQNVLALDTNVSAVVSVNNSPLMMHSDTGIKESEVTFPPPVSRTSSKSFPVGVLPAKTYVHERPAPKPPVSEKQISITTSTQTISPAQCTQPALDDQVVLTLRREDEAGICPQKNPTSIWLWLVATNMISAIIPSMILRIIIMGIMVDFCFMSLSQNLSLQGLGMYTSRLFSS